MKKGILTIILCFFILIQSSSVSGEEIQNGDINEEPSWKSIGTWNGTLYNSSTADIDIDKDPTKPPKTDIFPLAQLLSLFMYLLIMIYFAILKKRYRKIPIQVKR